MVLQAAGEKNPTTNTKWAAALDFLRTLFMAQKQASALTWVVHRGYK